ncbi:MAG: tetratricopeptide repeat protein [Brevundimonas sp.]|nr:MAG: tetratricopeptide repeat protein [Brevundimonas sp.]
MSRTTACIATVALFAALASPALAQQPPTAPAATSAPAPRPAGPESRAAADRADALTRSVFWTQEAEIAPNDTVAGVKASQALRELGRYDQAADMAQRVLMVQPANYDAQLELGRAHIARGQAFYGILALERARDTNPGDWRPWSLLGTAYEQVRRSEDARAAWAQALAISPENPDVLTNMAVSAMARGDNAAAEPLLRRAAAQPAASLKVRLNLAMVLGLNGKLGEAEQQAAAMAPGRTWGSLQGG